MRSIGRRQRSSTRASNAAVTYKHLRPSKPVRRRGHSVGNTQYGRTVIEGATMKAVRLHREGGPEQLVYEDAPKPQLGAGDALIRVHATGITPAELSWAETYRNCDGSDRLPAIPGHEVSGVVESVADGVSDVSIGSTPFFPCRATSTGSTPAVLATVSNLIPG